MEDMLTLTPEQLFILGTLMNAKHINYDYIASLGEIRRNYNRVRRNCLDTLAQAGVLRERLSGEVSVRPVPKALLSNLFFGKKESSLEIFTLGRVPVHTTSRFHWLDSAVTRVDVESGKLTLSQSSAAQIEALVAELVGGTETPLPAAGIQPEAVTRLITAKRAVIGKGSSGIVLFEQPGGLYTVDEAGKPVGIPANRARAMILAELKGE